MRLYNTDIVRWMLNLNPAYTWAVEDFAKMREEIPNFDKIYEGRKPQCFIVVQLTAKQVRVELAPGKFEWHSREHYIIVPSLLPH